MVGNFRKRDRKNWGNFGIGKIGEIFHDGGNQGLEKLGKFFARVRHRDRRRLRRTFDFRVAPSAMVRCAGGNLRPGHRGVIEAGLWSSCGHDRAGAVQPVDIRLSFLTERRYPISGLLDDMASMAWRQRARQRLAACPAVAGCRWLAVTGWHASGGPGNR